jgi:hypothetical protein
MMVLSSGSLCCFPRLPDGKRDDLIIVCLFLGRAEHGNNVRAVLSVIDAAAILFSC